MRRRDVVPAIAAVLPKPISRADPENIITTGEEGGQLLDSRIGAWRRESVTRCREACPIEAEKALMGRSQPEIAVGGLRDQLNLAQWQAVFDLPSLDMKWRGDQARIVSPRRRCR